ncbi:hypothetical protein OCK02_21325 [Rhizobium sp. TRM96647]|nr:hypothetical protein [Rhizobium sp. TRM96647]
MIKTKSAFTLIEIVAVGAGGYVPLGIVNLEQALSMPNHPALQFSHPGLDPQHGRIYIDRAILHDMVASCTQADF